MTFCVGSQVQHQTPEEGWRMCHSKHCEYINEDEDNSPNTLSNKNYQTLSQKFKHIHTYVNKNW